MRICVGLPGYRRDGFDITLNRTLEHIQNSKDVELLGKSFMVSSLLAHGFNKLWAGMLNARKQHGWTHFFMLHADIEPISDGWFNTMVSEMERFNLDAIAVSVGIRGDIDETSTAQEAVGNEPLRRLKIKETAGITLTSSEKPGLLINTGCLLMRADRDWCEKFYFDIQDSIVKQADGTFLAITASEDWNMSRFFAANNIRYGATGKVKVLHYGLKGYTNW